MGHDRAPLYQGIQASFLVITFRGLEPSHGTAWPAHVVPVQQPTNPA
jgi:hypothetical protein